MARFETFQDPREREALLALWAVPGLGVAMLHALRAAVGGRFAAILDVPVSEFLALLPATQAGYLEHVPTLADLAAGVRERAVSAGIGITFQGEDAYPERLLDLKDPPPLLFHLGPVGVSRRRIGMVGTRHPSPEGSHFAWKTALAIAEQGLGVVSGAAIGIDTRCHRGALNRPGAETWAFVAAGLDELDPPQLDIARHILEGGGRVMTEYPPGVRPDKGHFPRRNRLIAAASDVTVVFEAPYESGSLYTAGKAAELGRPLLTVPGALGDARTAGNLRLLKEYPNARVCTGPEDLLRAAGINPDRTAPQKQAGRSLDGLELSDGAKRVYAALNDVPRVLEEVLGVAGLDPAEASAALCELELAGLAVRHPGRFYEKV